MWAMVTLQSAPARCTTIGEAIDKSGRDGNSFDAIRLLAAIAVLVSHAFVITSGSEANEPLYEFTEGRLSIGFVAVGVFFSISGFLIDRSRERSRSLASFARKRFLRIAPGLWTSLILTTVFAAAFLADEGWRLLTRPTTWSFLGNALLLPVSQLLPGVFDQAPLPQVFNGSLWTLKYEAMCYVLTVAVGLLGSFRAPGLAFVWLVSLVGGNVTDAIHATGVRYYLYTLFDLFQFFGLGMILNQNRYRIPNSAVVAFILLAFWLAALATPFSREVTPLLVTYPAITIGAMFSRLAQRISGWGDMSYGVYVYAFPIQQLFTPFSLMTATPWAVNILLSLPVTCAIAALSWLYIEKPALVIGAERADYKAANV